MKSHVSTSTPFGLYINKREGGGVCELLDGRGWSHGNVVLGPRALNGEGFRSKPKKKYIIIEDHLVCVYSGVWLCAWCVVCGVRVCVCACVSVCACVCASVRVCECASVWLCAWSVLCVRVHMCVRIH